MATDIIARGMASDSIAKYGNLTYLIEDLDIMDYNNVAYTYDGSKNLTSVVWKNSSNVTVRTDTFTYQSTAISETIIQSIVVSGGSSIVVTTVFNLDGDVLSVNKVVT